MNTIVERNVGNEWKNDIGDTEEEVSGCYISMNPDVISVVDNGKDADSNH